MQQAYRTIALNFGYVEEAKISWFIYKSDKVFLSKKDALRSLALYLFEKYKRDLIRNHTYAQLEPNKDCCKGAYNASKFVSLRCGKCNQGLINFNNITINFWQQYLYELYDATIDGYGEHELLDNVDGWSPWEYQFTHTDDIIVINENAEHILAMALAEVKPGLFDAELEDIQDHIVRYYDSLDNDICDNEFVVETCLKYNNGAYAIMANGLYTYIKYNTGDQIWLEFDFEKQRYNVTKCIAHDS